MLGAAAWQGLPSPEFDERIKHAINLYKRGNARYLIFTSGVGAGDVLAESEVARNYAISFGVPPQVIFYQTTSKITYENLAE